MKPDAFGYVVCTSCHGSFHETDVVEGECWLCRNDGDGVDVHLSG